MAFMLTGFQMIRYISRHHIIPVLYIHESWFYLILYYDLNRNVLQMIPFILDVLLIGVNIVNQSGHEIRIEISLNVWVPQHHAVNNFDMSTIKVSVYLGLQFKYNQHSPNSNNAHNTSFIHKGLLAGKWPDLLTSRPDAVSYVPC